jgi:hypothetical protein
VIEGKLEVRIEMTGRRGRGRKQLLDDLKGKEKILEIERGSNRSHFVENSLWERLWTYRKIDYVVVITKMRLLRRYLSENTMQLHYKNKTVNDRIGVYCENHTKHKLCGHIFNIKGGGTYSYQCAMTTDQVNNCQGWE